MLGSTERRKVKLIFVKLFSKNSDVCDHNPPTSHTDRQTYSLSWQYRPKRSVARYKYEKNYISVHSVKHLP